MNYADFCCGNGNINTLTGQEIKNPLLALKTLCKKRNYKDFQRELSELFVMVLDPKEWRKYDPLTIYHTCLDLSRLRDILYLLNQHQPELGVLIPPEKETPPLAIEENDIMYVFNNIFPSTDKQKKISTDFNVNKPQPTTLSILHNNLGTFLNDALYNYLQVSLNATYMGSDIYYYFNIQDQHITLDFLALERIIKEAYRIHKKQPLAFSKLQPCPELKFAIDTDCPARLNLECMANPLIHISSTFEYYINTAYLTQSLNIWMKMLYEKNIWKKSNNPGNVLRFHEILETTIETIWIYMQSGKMEKDSKKYNPKQIKKTASFSLNKGEYNNPFLTIRNFFEHQKLHEWKNKLKQWLEYSLSNSETLDKKSKSEVKKDFNLVLKLLETAHVISNSISSPFYTV